MTLRCEAFAKVNRSLVVLSKREDGYHELDTLFQTIDLSDELTFEVSADLTLACDDPSLPAGEENLVIRAARALAGRAGIAPSAAIGLAKRIPHGAGLGGGSSDAAATLLGLRALWGLDVGEGALSEIAATLGSDVPFFLVGGLARGTGRGDRLEPLQDPPRQWLVLLSPDFPLSTPAVYGRLALTGAAPASNLRGSELGVFPDRNDLEPAAESLRIEVRVLRERLLEAGAASARLSGSGSTVFGIFSSEGEARQASGCLERARVEASIRVVPTLSREEFRLRSTPRHG